MVTHASQVLAEEPRLEIQGVLTKDKFEPQTVRDKIRSMFEQKETHRKEKEKLEEKAQKKSKARAKENTNKAGKIKASKKKHVDPSREVHANEFDDDEPLAGPASGQRAHQNRGR